MPVKYLNDNKSTTQITSQPAATTAHHQLSTINNINNSNNNQSNTSEDDLDSQVQDGFLDDDIHIPLMSPATARDDFKSCCPSQQYENYMNLSSNSSNEDAHTTYKMIIAVILCFIFMITEFIGGYFAGSLAIMTDAAHLSSDCISFVIGILSISISRKKPDSCMSFGYRRMEIFGAVASILTIWFLTAFLVYMAVVRIVTKDYSIDADLMLIASSVGIIMNILMAVILHGSCLPKMFHFHSHNHNKQTNNPSETVRNNNNNNNNNNRVTVATNNTHNNDRNIGSSNNSGNIDVCIQQQQQQQQRRQQNQSQNLLLQTQRTSKMNVYVDSNEVPMPNKTKTNNNSNNSNVNNNGNNINASNAINTPRNKEESKLIPSHLQPTQQQLYEREQDHFQLCFHQRPQNQQRFQQKLQQHQRQQNSLMRLSQFHNNNNNRRISRNELLISSDTSSSNSVSSVVKYKIKKNFNLRAAMLHVLGDLIQSFGVFLASVLIKLHPAARIADPICTIIFSIIVIATTLKIIKESIFILLDSVPSTIIMEDIEDDLKRIEGVKAVHEMNVWSLSVNYNIMTAHIVIDKNVDSQKILSLATQLVRNRYHIHQTTFQIERVKTDDNNHHQQLRLQHSSLQQRQLRQIV